MLSRAVRCNCVPVELIAWWRSDQRSEPSRGDRWCFWGANSTAGMPAAAGDTFCGSEHSSTPARVLMVTSSREWRVAVQDTACSKADLPCSNQDLSPSHMIPAARYPLPCPVARGANDPCAPRNGVTRYVRRWSRGADCLLSYTKLGACALPSTIKGPSSCQMVQMDPPDALAS